MYKLARFSSFKTWKWSLDSGDKRHLRTLGLQPTVHIIHFISPHLEWPRFISIERSVIGRLAIWVVRCKATQFAMAATSHIHSALSSDEMRSLLTCSQMKWRETSRVKAPLDPRHTDNFIAQLYRAKKSQSCGVHATARVHENRRNWHDGRLLEQVV